MEDRDLLADYVTTGSRDVLGQLISRHLDLVYSAALRQLRDSHLAHDVTQAVFLVLLRRAHTIANPAALAAWLLSTTRYACKDAIKQEHRRQRHERSAAKMAPTSTPAMADSTWDEIAPQLDDALAKLSDADRTAVVLRYFERKSHSEVATALGITEAAAQKRIARAIDRLRDFFARKQISTAMPAILPLLAVHAKT